MGSVGKENLGYNQTRMRNIERVRENSETRRIVEEARRQNALGTRNWNPKEGDRANNVSYDRAEKELFNAPVGTVITMSKHSTGDYVGEYTRTESGWRGSQQYRSSYKTPSTVTTGEGFAMQVSGNDIKVITVGKRRK